MASGSQESSHSKALRSTAPASPMKSLLAKISVVCHFLFFASGDGEHPFPLRLQLVCGGDSRAHTHKIHPRRGVAELNPAPAPRGGTSPPGMLSTQARVGFLGGNLAGERVRFSQDARRCCHGRLLMPISTHGVIALWASLRQLSPLDCGDFGSAFFHSWFTAV